MAGLGAVARANPVLERNSALGKKLTKEDEVDPILDEQGLHLLLEALHLLVVLVVGVVAARQHSHQAPERNSCCKRNSTQNAQCAQALPFLSPGC